MATLQMLTYQEVIDHLPPTKHLLLGNGFSIACDSIFNYPNLFTFARENGLTEHVCEAFDYLGTNNFEGVMRLLEDGQWLAEHYGLSPEPGDTRSMADDLESVKRALVEALIQTHLPATNYVADERKARCVEFLSPYHTNSHSN